MNRVIREGRITKVEVSKLGFTSVLDEAKYLRDLFKVVAYRDSATDLIRRKGYQVSRKTLDRYGPKRNTIINKSNNPKTGREDSRYIYENNKEDTILLEALAQIQSELKNVYGLEFDKHHLVPVSKEGSYNISNIRLIPSKVNKWIEEDYYTEEEINQKIADNSRDRHFKGSPWAKALTAEKFIELFVEVHTSLPKV